VLWTSEDENNYKISHDCHGQSRIEPYVTVMPAL
jgi:hypothetical protein